MTTMNTQILMVSRPTGEPTLANFKLTHSAVPELGNGQVLVRHHYLSLDPYMRGRMNDVKSYAKPQAIDEVMGGGTVGEVIESRHAKFAVGDKVVGMGGWQQYSVVNGDIAGVLRKVDDSVVPLSAHLGVLGMPGATAWVGLSQIVVPKDGETVVVSAASGAVGSAVGQLVQVRGGRAVGIAGGAEKCAYVVKELGFDACIDYKAHRSLAELDAALKDACPKGVDGYFDNVGGVVLDAVMQRMNDFGRIAVCGMIAGYNGEPMPMANPMLILRSRLKMQGFIVSEYMQLWPAALKELGTLVASQRVKYRETIAPDLASAPEAFIGLLKGRNLGKQLVKLL
jgi:NADPH-dependent curcumin reductase